ncbi:MAG: LPS assembly lipoprotein LptE [Gammaproteobacteria bacterium]|nr:LPS assembly lipoprotein LptE [Gammaproteobacteria bacterium]
MRVPVWYVVLLAIILAQGCGYHLRGQSLDRGADKGGDRTPVAYRVHIIGAAGPLADALRARLVTAGATLSAGRKDADYTLTLHGEEFLRQVASVSPATGKVEEYLIVFNTRISISNADGEALVTLQPIRVSGDYAFDEDAALGKFAEEEIIKEELLEQAAARITERLNTLAQ